MLENDVDYKIEILRYRQSEKHKGEKAIFAVLQPGFQVIPMEVR
jgi:hypothetical protein